MKTNKLKCRHNHKQIAKHEHELHDYKQETCKLHDYKTGSPNVSYTTQLLK